MKFFRKERMGSVIQRELSMLVNHEIEFADRVFVTITDVVVATDLETAKVKVSVLPAEKADGAMRVLAKFQPRLQGMLLRIMNVRPMPHILFELDKGAENAAEVEKSLLKDHTI